MGPVPLPALAFSLGRITFVAIGGGAMATVRRELVRRRGWLTDDEFIEILALAQIAPGPTLANIAILTGLRLRGNLGAAVAWAGMTLPSLILLFGIALLLLRGSSVPVIAGALRGCAAGTVGLMLANAIELTRPRVRRLGEMIVIVSGALAITLLDVSLVDALGVLFPLSLVLTRLLG